LSRAIFAPAVPGAGAYLLSSLPQSFYDGLAGEAETASAGEPPGRGISGRNSSRAMRGRAVSGGRSPWLKAAKGRSGPAYWPS